MKLDTYETEDWIKGKLRERKTPIAKHPYGGSDTHSTGSGQEAHGGDASYDELVNLKPKVVIDPAIPSSLRPLIRRAVAKFDKRFPGGLPPVITFRHDKDHSDSQAMAWVVPLEMGDIVHFDSDLFLSEQEVQAVAIPWAAVSNRIALEKYGIDNSAGNSDLEGVLNLKAIRSLDPGSQRGLQNIWRESLIFHELSHIAARHHSIMAPYIHGPLLDENFPAYESKWYPKAVTAADRSLPSTYAARASSEYFAEALTDAAYRGSKAAKLSQLTAKRFMEVVRGDREVSHGDLSWEDASRIFGRPKTLSDIVEEIVEEDSD